MENARGGDTLEDARNPDVRAGDALAAWPANRSSGRERQSCR